MKQESLAKALFVLSIFVSLWLFGALSYKFSFFPAIQLDFIIANSTTAITSLLQTLNLKRGWWYSARPGVVEQAEIYDAKAMAPGYVLLNGISANNQVMARIVDNDGQILHAWDVDWFRLWPEPQHLPEDSRPKIAASAHPHGMAFLDNGDLVFNFEDKGMIRLNYCGDVVWRLPYQTHHSIHLDESGNFWVSGRVRHDVPLPEFPNHRPPFYDFTVLEVSPDGEILSEISVIRLLIENDLDGLLYMASQNNWSTAVSGDTLHLNDVETFPSTLSEGLFTRGDVMISLRNINAIVVFDKDTRKIKYINVGSFIRQHDPDFVDGNTISVFDNNNLSPFFDRRHSNPSHLSSRIAILDARTNRVTDFYKGTKEHPFFSDIMGKHQWLPNGNLLVTEARSGRAFEISPPGKLLWEYNNLVEDGVAGLLDGAQRLPARVNHKFLTRLGESCATS